MTHIVKRSMSLLLAVLFCLSLVTLPALAMEDDLTQQEQTVAAPAPDQGGDPDGEGQTTPTDQTPEPEQGQEESGSDDTENLPANNDGEENTDQDQPTDEPQNSEENGEADEQEGEDETPVVSAKANVPDGFFKKVQIGREYDRTTGEMIGFPGEANVAWDASCALRFDYVVPEDAKMYAGTEYLFSVEAPLVLDVPFNILNEEGKVVAIGGFQQSTTDPTQVTGKITFKDQSYLESGTTGHFFVQAMFNKAQNAGGGNQKITITVTGNISDTISVNFEAPVAEASVKLEKKSSVVAEELICAHEIEWTLVVTPEMKGLRAGDEKYINSLVVTDQITTEKLTYVDGSAKATVNGGTAAEGTFVYDETTGILTFSGAGTDLKGDAWPITITFRTAYDLSNSKNQVDYYGNLTFSNSASAKITAPQYDKDDAGNVYWKDSTPEDPQQEKNATASANANIAYVSLNKQGSLESGNHVKWTVTTKNALKDKGSYIEDTLPKYMKLSSKITLNGKELSKGKDATTGAGYEYTYNEETKQGKLTLYLDETSAEQQVFVYETAFDSAVDRETLNSVTDIVNQVRQFFGSDLQLYWTREASIHIGNALMAKEGTYDKQTHEITWRVTLKTDRASLTDVTLRDTFIQQVEGSNISQTYVLGSMKIVRSDGSLVRKILDSELTLDEGGTGFTLKIADAHPQSEILEYKTVLKDISGVGLEFWGNNNDKFQIQNTISVTAPGLSGKAEVTGTVNGTSTVLVKEAGSYNYKDKTIRWNLKVNRNEMAITKGKIEDTLSGLEWIYAKDKGVSVQQNGSELAGVTVSYSEDMRTMTIDLPDLPAGSKELSITYYTTLANQDSLLTNETLTVDNTATLTGDEIMNPGVQAKASKTIGQNVLKKALTKALDENNELTWTVDVNRNLATIQTSDPEAKIGIVDTLQEGLSYVAGSLRVYPLNIDEEGKEHVGAALAEGTDYTVTYDKATRSLRILWNDNKLTEAYRLTFQTLVMVSKEYTNSVSFVGVVQNTWSSSGGVSAQAMFGGGFTRLPASLGELHIVKKDGTTGTPLPNTTFKIYDAEDVLIGTFTTDSDGKITTVLPVGWYTIEEITPPNGYVLPTNHTWKVEVKSKKLTTETISNYQDTNVATYAPEVTKALQGITASTEKFTFQLEAKNGAPMPLEDTAEVTGAGQARFGQIQYTVPGTYEYTITEEDGGADRYTYDTKPHTLTVTVTRDAATNQLTATAKYDDDQDTLTITNTYTPSLTRWSR